MLRVVHSSLTAFRSKKLDFKNTAFKISSLNRNKILFFITNKSMLRLFTKIIHVYSDIRKLTCLHALSLLYNGDRVFLGGKVRPGRGADHSPPSCAAVMEE